MNMLFQNVLCKFNIQLSKKKMFYLGYVRKLKFSI